MRKIKLTKGFYTLIDDKDFERVTQHSWCTDIGKSYIRAFANINYKIVKLHRFILNINDPKIKVDHINGNTLDNRRQNLRLCSHKENIRNQKQRINKSSKFKGVSWNKNSKKWECYITTDNQTKKLGYFASELEAAKTYNKAAKKYHKKFARLNKI